MNAASGFSLTDASASVMFQWLQGDEAQVQVPAGWDVMILPMSRTVFSAFPGIPLIHVLAGSVLLIPANTCTSFTFGSRHDAAMLIVHPALRAACNASLALSDHHVPATAIVLQDPPSCAARLSLQLLQALPRSDCPNFLSSLAEILLISLSKAAALHAFSSLNVTGRQLTNAELHQIDQLIKDKLEEPIRLDDLARLSDMSAFHFLRCFKRTTGLSPLRYVLTRRMERVCLMLDDANVRIAEVTYAAGFSSQSHLTTTFRRFFGVTPGAFRRKLLARRANLSRDA